MTVLNFLVAMSLYDLGKWFSKTVFQDVQRIDQRNNIKYIGNIGWAFGHTPVKDAEWDHMVWRLYWRVG